MSGHLSLVMHLPHSRIRELFKIMRIAYKKGISEVIRRVLIVVNIKVAFRKEKSIARELVCLKEKQLRKTPVTVFTN